MVELACLVECGGGACLHFWFKSFNFLVISDRNSFAPPPKSNMPSPPSPFENISPPPEVLHLLN